MPCSRCEATTVAVGVPESLSAFAPGEAVLVCTRCLTVEPTETGESDPDLDRISEALPEGDVGVAVLLLVDRLDSLALNRADIEDLVAFLEDEGVDPLLVLDRLAEQPDLDPVVAIGRRRHQLEQLVL